MKFAVTRGLGLVAVLLMVGSSIGAAAPAAAAEKDLGWLRFTPAQGTLSDPIDALAESDCPAGESVMASVVGPGIPKGASVGKIVGSTLIRALPPTESGQLYVPLSATLRDWFGRNVPDLKPSGTYTVVVTCRDSLRASVVHGNYTGQVLIKGDAYTAVGEAGEPFNTVKNGDALTGDLGGTGSQPSANPEASQPSDSSTDARSESTPPASIEATADATADQEAVTEPSAVAAVSAPGSDSGGWASPSFLVGAAAVLLGGAWFVSSRRRPVPSGSHESPAFHDVR